MKKLTIGIISLVLTGSTVVGSDSLFVQNDRSGPHRNVPSTASLMLSAGVAPLSLEMRPSLGEKAAIDHAVASPLYRTKQRIKFASGAMAVTGLVGAIIANAVVQSAIDESYQLKHEYWDLDNTNFKAEYTAKLDENARTARSAAVVRSCCYVAAVLGSIGLSMTFYY